MKDMREVYPGYFNERWDYPCGYEAMIDSFGEVLVEVEDRDYQGDTRVLLKGEDGRLGHLIFGWGSCSGCDALQGTGSYDELNELAESLYSGIKWFDSQEECLKWFNEHDWKGDYSWHYEETREYVEKVKEFLNK